MAATGAGLRGIAKKRLKAAKILLDAQDWESAAYLLALALECALKAVTCKTLRLVSYPQYTRKKEIDSYFMTHKFDQLLIVSGMVQLFSITGNAAAFRNWSDFTIEYPGDWPSMRYDHTKVWDRATVEKLYNNLVAPTHGIISEIVRRKKW